MNNLIDYMTIVHILLLLLASVYGAIGGYIASYDNEIRPINIFLIIYFWPYILGKRIYRNYFF
jgi:hypothetical protein